MKQKYDQQLLLLSTIAQEICLFLCTFIDSNESADTNIFPKNL